MFHLAIAVMAIGLLGYLAITWLFANALAAAGTLAVIGATAAIYRRWRVRSYYIAIFFLGVAALAAGVLKQQHAIEAQRAAVLKAESRKEKQEKALRAEEAISEQVAERRGRDMAMKLIQVLEAQELECSREIQLAREWENTSMETPVLVSERVRIFKQLSDCKVSVSKRMGL